MSVRRTEATLKAATKAFHAVAGTALLLLAVALVGVGPLGFGQAAPGGGPLLPAVPDGTSRVVFAIAVFYLAGFLMEEAPVREREMRSLHEARLPLNKLFTVVILVLLLEAVVLVFETKLEEVQNVIYPGSLVVVGVLALVGLGVSRRLTADGRATDPAVDRTGEGEAGEIAP